MEEFVRILEGYFTGRYEVCVKNICRNNGTVYTGMVFNSIGGIARPVIRLEKYYQEYEEGKDLSAIIREIEAEVGEAKLKEPFDPEILFDFEKIKDKIRIRVVNRDWNRELLEKRVHRDICDLSLIYAVDMGRYLAEIKEGRPVVYITGSELATWGVTEEDLYQTAIDNMKRESGFTVIPLDNLLRGICGGNEYQESSHLFLLRDISDNYPGTAAMADTNCLRKMSEMVGGSFYIFPSSVHELLLLPTEYVGDTDELNQVVREANRKAVSREEQLSDHVYLYDADKDEIVAF